MGHGYRNAAVHTEDGNFTAWVVSHPATIDGHQGTMSKEFKTPAAAAKYAATVQQPVTSEVARTRWDWKPNTIQSGCVNDRQTAGRWTGRIFTWKPTAKLEFTDVELKIDGSLCWAGA